ncbi:MAG: DUF3592 domain-containing protein [Planctomycetota bacterium]|nr:DUF3592 domain-containing protein [Planctomycetota bacterium]
MTVLVVSLVVAAIGGFRLVVKAPNYPAATEGRLDDRYTERTGRRGRRYDVKYAFTVDGKTFRGSDTIHHQPTTPHCTVYYEPSNPNDNGLTKRKMETWAMVAGVLGVLGAFGAVKRLAPEGRGD